MTGGHVVVPALRAQVCDEARVLVVPHPSVVVDPCPAVQLPVRGLDRRDGHLGALRHGRNTAAVLGSTKERLR